jgi:peptide/nickel transport system permease protein
MTEVTERATAPPVPPDRKRARRRGGGRIGVLRIRCALTVIAVYVVAAVVGPLWLAYDSVATHTEDRLLPPGAVRSDGSIAVFGTDQVGQDLLAQMLQGARVSIAVGLATLLLAGLLGVTIGVVAGYFGGWIDGVLMRLADVQLAFPQILLAIFIAALLGPSVTNVVIVLSVTSWVTFARVVRSQVLTVRGREYVDATRTLGAGTWHVIRRCVLPACVAPVLVVATVELGHVILAEAALSFLGLGTPTSTPSWGVTIANGRNYLADAWWIATIPGIALAVLVVMFGVLGDALRDRYDPRLKSL